MLNFEREMLIDNEVDILEVMSVDGALVEHDPNVKGTPEIIGKYPLVWEWTLQDENGAIWTELVDTLTIDEL